MSSRHLRRLTKQELPTPDDSSEEETFQHSNKNTYSELLLSSSSESESESEVPIQSDVAESQNEKPKKKNKKTQKASKKPQLDDVERSLREVNALLGEPSQIVTEPQCPESIAKQQIFGVERKHLRAANEIRRFLGKDSSKEDRRNAGRNNARKYSLIDKEYNFSRGGLSMTVIQREAGRTYFVFNHDMSYKRKHIEFLIELVFGNPIGVGFLDPNERSVHVEANLEAVDRYCLRGEHQIASDIIDKIVAFLQFVAHPHFILTDINTRLEYQFYENRMFHVTMLKYLHLLSNKACHRTALELAKMLLNLDPSDPLAIIFIIDTLALRARKHKWLIEAIDFMKKDRDVMSLVNIQFSYALAHFHVASKDGNMQVADDLLQKAMMHFPSVFIQILLKCNQAKSDRFSQHPLFNSYAIASTSKSLQKLIVLYTAFTGARWMEPAVNTWLLRNANELLDKYDNEPTVKNEILELAKWRRSLFRGCPDEICRHLYIIKSMSELLVDGAVPDLKDYASTVKFNPLPPEEGVQRNMYANIDPNNINFELMSLEARARPTRLVENPHNPEQPQAQALGDKENVPVFEVHEGHVGPD